MGCTVRFTMKMQVPDKDEARVLSSDEQNNSRGGGLGGWSNEAQLFERVNVP